MDAELQAKLDKRFSLVESQQRPRGRRSRVLCAASAIDEKLQKSSPPQDAKAKLSTFVNGSMMLVNEIEKMKHEPPELTPVPINYEKLQKALTDQAATMTSLQEENGELHQKNHSLSMEVYLMRKKFEQLKDQLKQAAADLEKAEENLKTLHVIMEEEHAASAACELLQQKKSAVTLVKNNIMKSREWIFGVDEVEVGGSVSWCDRRDPVGLTVWRYAQDLRAHVPALRMQECLKQLGVGNKQLEGKVQPVDAPVVEQNSIIDAGECLVHASLVRLFNSMFRRGHGRC